MLSVEEKTIRIDINRILYDPNVKSCWSGYNLFLQIITRSGEEINGRVLDYDKTCICISPPIEQETPAKLHLDGLFKRKVLTSEIASIVKLDSSYIPKWAFDWINNPRKDQPNQVTLILNNYATEKKADSDNNADVKNNLKKITGELINILADEFGTQSTIRTRVRKRSISPITFIVRVSQKTKAAFHYVPHHQIASIETSSSKKKESGNQTVPVWLKREIQAETAWLPFN